jgi:hypothetical protein
MKSTVSTPAPAPSPSGSNAGAIAGGVIGGLAFISIVTFLVWWFLIRKRRQAQAEEEQEKSSFRQERQSRRSMNSIASTVLTRASNIIQIAYIPGVTNRSPPDTPGTLVPPVPPLPSAHASAYGDDQHFFMPGDLRDSHYSDMTTDRRSIATSLARSSVATTIYRNDAIVSPMPALQALRGKAAVVSVKSGANTPIDTLSVRTMDIPGVPTITEAQLKKANAVGPTNSSIVARSVVARPVNVKKPSPPKVPTVSEEELGSEGSSDGSSSLSPASHSRAHQSTFDDSSDDDDNSTVPSHRQSGVGTATDGSTTPVDPIPASLLHRNLPSGAAPREADPLPESIQISLSADEIGPFADPSTSIATPESSNSTEPSTAVTSSRASTHNKSNSVHRHRTSLGSNRMLEDTIERDSTASTHRSQSPFSDEHEVK